MVTLGSKVASTAAATSGEQQLDTYGHRDHRSLAGLCQSMSEMSNDTTLATNEVMRDASNPTVGSPQQDNRDAQLPAEYGRFQKKVETLERDTRVIFLISAEADAKAFTEGCVEGTCAKNLLEGPTETRNLKIWTAILSARAILPRRLGPGRRAKHLEVQTMRVQKKNNLKVLKIGEMETRQTC